MFDRKGGARVWRGGAELEGGFDYEKLGSKCCDGRAGLESGWLRESAQI